MPVSTSDRPARAPRGASPFVREHVLDTLGRRILAGDYPQGTTLPTESQLCTEFGVSRTSVREAVKMLAAKGLVVSRQRAGTRVQEAESWNRLDPDVLGWMNASAFDLDFAQGLLEARHAIEPAAARWAAMRATARDLAAIEIAYEAMRSAEATDLPASAEADLAFHSAILRASHNPVFAALIGLIGHALTNSFRVTTSVSRSHVQSLDVHGDVFEAIRLRQPDLASERMHALIEFAAKDMRLHAEELARRG
jgi:DNA-binding FadR family transcriptional regulator